MPKRITAADSSPYRVVIVTMDSHLSSATARAAQRLAKEMPGVSVTMHAADEWGSEPAALERCCTDIERGDIVIATMLFLEDHFMPVLKALQDRRERCDAMICAMSAAPVVRLTRLGRFAMDGKQSGALSLLKAAKALEEGRPHGGRRPDENAAANSAAAALHTGHRTGCACVFPDSAVLVGGVRGQCLEHGAILDRAFRRRSAQRVDVRRESCASHRISGGGCLSPRYEPALRRSRGESAGGRRQRHRRSAAAAVVPARRQQRPLRRSDRGARSARLARHSRLRGGLGCAAGNRRLFYRRWGGQDRCPAVAHRVFIGRRSCLQRFESGGRHLGGLGCALSRRASGGISNRGRMGILGARSFAGGVDHHGGDPGTRRLHEPDGIRRSFDGGRMREGHGGARGARRHARRPRRQSRRHAARLANRSQGRHRAVQFPAECGKYRHCRLPVGLRVAPFACSTR